MQGTDDSSAGEPGVSGERGELTLFPGERLAELRRARDEATEREVVRELTWVANRDLPRIPLLGRLTQQWLTTDDWSVPGPADDIPEAKVRWAPTWLLREGMMNYEE